MSLILEALRKSEERRKLGEAPTLISESAWSSRRRHPLARSDSRMAWVVGALLLAGLAAGAWWWWSRTAIVATKPEPARTARVATATPTPQPTPAAVAAAPAPIAAASPMPMPPPATQEPLTATDARIPEPLRIAGDASPAAPTTPAPEPQPVAAATPAPIPTPVASATPAPVASPAPTPIAVATPAPAELPALPEVWQLPLPTRQALPALALTMHVYSADPAQRFALINDKRVGENSPLDNGLDVREIRPDGVVLEFRGERFLLPRGGR